MPTGEVDKEIDRLKGQVKELGESLAAAKEKDSDRTESTLGERVRATLAIFVVVFLLALFGVVWIVFGIQNVERAAIFLLPLVTLVLGFYFGKEGKKAAEERAAKAGEERKSAELSEQAAKADSAAAKTSKTDDLKRTLAGLEATVANSTAILKKVEKGRKALEKKGQEIE